MHIAGTHDHPRGFSSPGILYWLLIFKKIKNLYGTIPHPFRNMDLFLYHPPFTCSDYHYRILRLPLSCSLDLYGSHYHYSLPFPLRLGGKGIKFQTTNIFIALTIAIAALYINRGQLRSLLSPFDRAELMTIPEPVARQMDTYLKGNNPENKVLMMDRNSAMSIARFASLSGIPFTLSPSNLGKKNSRSLL